MEHTEASASPSEQQEHSAASLSGQSVKTGTESVDFDLEGSSKHWDTDTFRDRSCQSQKEMTRDLGIWASPSKVSETQLL